MRIFFSPGNLLMCLLDGEYYALLMFGQGKENNIMSNEGGCLKKKGKSIL